MNLSRLTVGETIEERMAATGGRTTGFDMLRITLAMSVLVYHSVCITYGTDDWIWYSNFRSLPAVILPMFFAISGFLVAGSLFRTRTLSSFITLRLLRIVPALFVEVCLSSLMLGLLVTTLPLHEYFSRAEFYKYWLNIGGYIHFMLPGVFESNPLGRIVNASIWTIPFEFQCYIGLAALGFVRRPGTFLWVFIFVSFVVPGVVYLTEGFDGFVSRPGQLLVLCFVAGLALYMFRERVPLNPLLFIAAVLMSLLLLTRAKTGILAPLPAAYVAVYIGLLNAPRMPVLSGGDYSYGVYLYAFPVQQTIVWLFPQIGQHHWWWMNGLLAIPCALGCAMVSWHLVEKPVLSRRKLALNFVESYDTAIRRWVAGLPIVVSMRKQPVLQPSGTTGSSTG